MPTIRFLDQVKAYSDPQNSFYKSGFMCVCVWIYVRVHVCVCVCALAYNSSL